MCDNGIDLAHILAQMDTAAQLTINAAKKLAIEVEDARLLAEQDRVQISRLIMLVNRLIDQGEVTLHGTQRLEKTAVHVAQDLAASIVRADKAPAETPGAGADAALRSPGETAAEVASHLGGEQLEGLTRL